MALPVTVQFRPEETMLSFASRLAVANGVGRLSNLCAHLGLNLNALVQGDEDQIHNLADFGGVDARLLMDRAFRSASDGLVWFGKERVAASAVHRRRMRACPQCLALDRDAEAGPAALPLWSLVHARRCFRHGSYLADSPSAVPNDFSASWNELDVSGGDVGGDHAFEIWANGRLEGHRGNAWIDQLDIDVVGECSQMIGLSLLFGKSRGIKTCGQTELADAVSSGFAVLAAGPVAILTFFEDLRYGEGADQDRPQGRYGRIHDWLKRGGGSGVRFELVRAILRNHIMSTWPLGRNELALDERVIERRFHSLQSAAKELDLHPKRLGKRLEAEGHLDLSRSGPDRLIPVWVISALRDGAFEDTGLGEATEILAVSKFTIDTLLDAGVLSRAPGGEGLRPRLDRSSVMAFSSWIAALPECDGQYGRDIRSICRLFRMTAADVLHMALEGKLPAVSRLTGRSDYHAIRILPEDVEAASGGQLKPLLDLHAVAQELGISMQMLTRIIEAGLLKTVERTPKEGVGEIPMILETDILRFKRDHTVRKAADLTGGGHDSLSGLVAADGTDVIGATDLGLSPDTDRSTDG